MDPQHLRRRKWLAGGDVEEGGTEEGGDEDDEEHQDEADVLRKVVIDLPALFDGVDHGGEVVVRKDHPTGIFRHVGATVHRHPDISGLNGRRVVDAIAGLSHGSWCLTHRGQRLWRPLGRRYEGAG